MRKPRSAIRVEPEDRSRPRSARARIGRRGEGRGRAGAHRRTAGRVRERSGRGRPRRTATARAVARPAGSCIAGRIPGPVESGRGPPARLARPVQPPIHEAECSDPSARSPTSSPRSTRSWPSGASGGRSPGCGRRTPAARSWSFLDGPITANNPMGVHHAWGRAYKDLYQRFHAMLGEDQRYQNGFDCQGLWVEVNVERDLGFTSKRDIEAYGIAEFVTLCKQRVLTYAARQTEQSIRLGMWMDWNDPHELRRLRDLLGADPAAVTTIRGPGGSRHRHRRDARRAAGHARHRRQLLHVQQREQRPDLGLPGRVPPARLAVQGPRHDAVVRALRHRHLADGDERGLPGPRRPRADRPLPAARPAGRGAAGLDDHALDADLERRRGRRCRRLRYVRVRQGDDDVLARQGHAQDGARRARSRSSRRSPGATSSAGATPARSTTCRPSGPRSRRARTTGDRAVRASGRRRGTRSARTRGPASSTSPRAAAPRTSSSARRSGCRSSRRSTRAASSSTASGRLSGRDVRDVAEPIVEHLKREGRFYRLETITHRYPHCWRCGTPLVFRLVDEWFISMGPLYDQPRETLTAEQVDASLRYQIMDVVDRIRWIPDFGYERELDWLRNMHDWMISKKRYWGLALPIYDCAACGTVEVIGGRDELHERAVEGWEAFEGHTPHRPYVDAVKIACPACGAPVERIKDVGNPWLDAGIVPFSTLHLPRGSRVLAAVVPGRLHHRELPGPVPQLVLLDAGDVHRPPPRASRSRRSSATPWCSARTAARCTRAGATRSSSTRRPTGWASTSCAGCSPRRGPRRTSCSAGTPPTRRGASCSSCGTSTPSS